jgi:hydroxymethylglutaryl-CoA lyase
MAVEDKSNASAKESGHIDSVKLIECPRDAWQGLPETIPAEEMAEYLKALVDASMRHIDAVSFVSPKHVRQMADSEDVMKRLLDSLPSDEARPELIGIVLNERGMERVLATPGKRHAACLGMTTSCVFPHTVQPRRGTAIEFHAG